MRYGDCADFLAEHSGEPLVLTVRGVDYSFPAASDDLSMLDALQLIQFRELALDLFTRAEAGEDVDLSPLDETRQFEIVEQIATRFDEKLLTRMRENLTRREYRHMLNTILQHYLWGSEVGQQTWTGQLDKVAGPLGENLGRTDNSNSTRTAPTGSTPTSTSKPQKRASHRGGQSKNGGRSSKPTSRASTGRTSAK